LGADSETIASAFLHDVLEDTMLSRKELSERFGQTVLSMVEGTTKLDRVAHWTRKVNSTKNVQRLMLAGSKDWRVLAIKLADRLHNLQTLEFLPVSDQRRIAAESLEVHAPIAHKLGIHDLVDQIHDCAFRHLDPQSYHSIRQQAEKAVKQRKKTLQAVIKTLKKDLPAHDAFFVTEKNPYKLYAKQTQNRQDLAYFSDVAVLCIQTRTVPECYAALGTLHARFPPVPKKIKDYIAIPQPNLYSALHTTVIGPDGFPMKVYIATEKMFDLNRRGVLALDEEAYRLFPFIRERVRKLNKLFALPKHFAEADEFMYALHRDFAPETIVVFNTKGETTELPRGSTPIDFVFHQNPQEAGRLWKVKINGRFVALDRRLEAGDIVEPLLSKQKQSNPNWMGFASTQTAKKRIRALAAHATALRNIDITIWADDQIGLLSTLTKALSNARINVLATTSLSHRTKNVTHFNVGNAPDERLSKALQELQKVRAVTKIKILNLNEQYK
jgi:GTP pyrophosphokinase